MNLGDFLLEGVSLGENLAFASGNPEIMFPTLIAGTVVETVVKMMEGWFGQGGSNGMVTVLEACTREIVDNIHALEKRLNLKLEQELQGLEIRDLNVTAEWLRKWVDILDPQTPHGASLDHIDEEVRRAIEASMQELTSQHNNLARVAEFAKEKLDADYSTLPLYLGATLVHLNACKFFSAIDYRLALQKFLDTPKDQRPARPEKNTGMQLVLNKWIYDSLESVVPYAAGLVHDINQSVTARQEAADQAAKTVSIGPAPGRPDRFSLNPTRAPNNPDDHSDDYVANAHWGFGALTKKSADTMAMLRNAQHRGAAWERETTGKHLSLLSLKEIRMLNTMVWSLHKAWKDYHGILDMDSATLPKDLEGIYPPNKPSPVPAPPPPKTPPLKANPPEEKPGVPLPPPDPYSARLRERGITTFYW